MMLSRVFVILTSTIELRIQCLERATSELEVDHVAPEDATAAGLEDLHITRGALRAEGPGREVTMAALWLSCHERGRCLLAARG